jgi:hypothetical protein
MNVPVTQVIAQNQNNVGLPEDGRNRGNGQEEAENDSFHAHALAADENANKKNP